MKSQADKTKRLKEIGFANYEAYLASPHWKSIKARLFQKKRKCQLCGSRAADTLHHITYDRIGRERDSDFLFFCQECHNILHTALNQRYPLRSSPYKAERSMVVLRGIIQGSITPKRKKRRAGIPPRKQNAYQSCSILPEEKKVMDELKEEHKRLVEKVRTERKAKHSP